MVKNGNPMVNSGNIVVNNGFNDGEYMGWLNDGDYSDYY